MNKFSIILIFVSLILTSCGAGKPKGGEGISYFGAAWLNNDRIIYTKQVETVKFHYGWLAEVANMTSELIRIDYFICTMDLNGEDEKILKQFSVTDPMGGKGVRRIFLIDDGKEVSLNTIPQRPSIYSCSKDLIVFVAHFSEGGAGGAGPIYTMKPDGSELKQIVEKGTEPRLSPDGEEAIVVAAPKQDNGTYTYLSLNIDRQKGIMAKSLLYQGDRLVQTLEYEGIEKFGKAWVPTKMVNTLHLSSGEFVTTTTFENVQLNTDIGDTEFDPNVVSQGYR